MSTFVKTGRSMFQTATLEMTNYVLFCFILNAYDRFIPDAQHC